MKINSIKYINRERNWKLEKTYFGRVTLLVGLSGVGKTQILNSINNLKDIVEDDTENLAGVEWEIEFVVDNKTYFWSGKFEVLDDEDSVKLKYKNFDDEDNNKLPKILKEELYLDDTLVFRRHSSEITYEGQILPKISPFKSGISIFTEEKKIEPIIRAFKKIYFVSYEDESKLLLPAKLMLDCKSKYSTEDSIINYRAPIIHKLALAFECAPRIFDSIKQDFIDVFSQVDDIKFENIADDKIYILKIKEKGTDWIPQYNISSGMYKTLIHIAEMRLLENESIVLIDEFENSLGINCIDIVADDISNNKRNMQFIITSHHPYIINNINMKNWKIVMRTGSIVYTKNASELNLGRSKHEAFKQLINLKDYIGGIS